MNNRNRGSNYLGDDLGRSGSVSPRGGRISPGGRNRVSLANVMAGNRMSRQTSPTGRMSVGRGSASRAGTASQNVRDLHVPGDNSNVALNSPDNIEKERRYAQLHMALKKEFEEADINRDGRVRKEDLVQFLMNKSGAD